ncbi:MAG: discoidin domain-containing protein [Acutalibacteraceae bacterium]|jgi:polygalacturonase/lysophospholipase L1-like esterase
MKLRSVLRRTVALSLALLLAIPPLTAAAANTTRTIVFVGDSLTAGSHASGSAYFYPQLIGRWLGDGFTVLNRGRSGNVLYGGGAQAGRQYPMENLQQDVTGADAVVIMLGTNDTKYWTDASLHDKFVEQYKATIAIMKEWNPTVDLILATPPTSTVTGATAEYANILLEDISAHIRNMVEQEYAADAHIRLMDINAMTKGWNVDHPDWYDDQVHFNNTGYKQLARLFYEEYWDTTVHALRIDGDPTVVIDNTANTIGILADPASLSGKTAVVSVAKKSQAPATLSLNRLPATLTVKAPYDGMTRKYRVFATTQTRQVVDRFDLLEAGALITATNVDGGYVATNAFDGDRASFWNTKSHPDNTFSETLSIDALAPLTVQRMVFQQKSSWAGRTEVVNLTASVDGETYFSVLQNEPLAFDPDVNGNEVAVTPNEPITARYWKLEVLSTTNYECRAQLGEWTLYGGQTVLIEPDEVPDFTGAPPVPCVSKVAGTSHDADWIHLHTNLQVGDAVYTNDPNTTAAVIEDPANDVIVSLPEKYRGADLIRTHRHNRGSAKFLTERDIDVYAAMDDRYASFPWSGWQRTDDAVALADGTTYTLYKKRYLAGVQVDTGSFGSSKDSQNNVFFILLPANGPATSNALTHDPVLPEGERDPAHSTDGEYRLYINDVFNTETGDGLPTGYAVVGGSGTAGISAIPEKPEPEPIVPPAAGTNMALGQPFTVSSDTWHGESPVDGDPTTYWQSQGNLTAANPAVLTVDLGYGWKINEIKLKLWPRWGDRVQKLEIQGSADGNAFTTLVPLADYTFVQNNNVVTVPVSEATARYLRVVGISNTGNGGVQIGEIEVYGPEQDPVTVIPEPDEDTTPPDRTLDMTGALTVERQMPTALTGRLVIETRVKAGAGAASVALCDPAGGESGRVALDGLFEGWHTVKWVVDTAAQTVQVWRDHLLIERDQPFAGAAVVAVRFTAADGMRIDTLRAADDTEIYLAQDDFNAQKTGEQPTGWDGGEVAEVPFAQNKSLCLSGVGATASRAIPATRGDLTVEVRVKPVTADWVTAPLVTDSEGRLAAKVAFYHNSIFINDGPNWAYVCDQVLAYAQYEANNWYDLRLVLNTDTRRYDLYVDGALRYRGAAFAEAIDAVERVTFRNDEENTLYVDELRVFDSASITRGVTGDLVFNVRDFGARGDGVTDDTAAIDAAIKAAAGTGGTVLLENGVFYTGQITLKSDMTFFVAPTATIYANHDRHAYRKVIPSNGYNGNRQLGRGIIFFQGEKNVRITGGGTIYGNGRYAFGENDPGDQRPCLLYFAQCENVTVEDLRMVQSPFWTVVPYESVGVTARHLDITNQLGPNRDGIDPVNTSYLTAEYCRIIAGDDAFCPKSGNQIPSTHIEARNCLLQSDCNGIKIGTDTQGPFTHFLFEDILIKRVGLSGLTVQSVDGSDIEDIRFQRIEMNDVDNALFICIGNRCRLPVPAGDAVKKLGSIRDLTFEDILFTNPMGRPYNRNGGENVHEAMIIGLNPEYNILNDGKEYFVRDILFKNVHMEMPGGVTAIPNPTSGIKNNYPEHDSLGTSSGWAYTLRWVDNVRFVNCTDVMLKNDARPEIARLEGSDNAAQTALRQAIDEAEATANNPSFAQQDESIRRPLEEALAAAWATYENNNATAADCAAAQNALQEALEGLDVTITVDKTALQAAVEDRPDDPDQYTAASYAAYQQALMAAMAVLADEDATQYTVNAALKALRAAKDGLEIDWGADPLNAGLRFTEADGTYAQLLYGWMYYVDWKTGDTAPADLSGTAPNGANKNLVLRATVRPEALKDGVDVRTAWKEIGLRLRSAHVGDEERASGFIHIPARSVVWKEDNSFDIEIPLSDFATDKIDWSAVRQLHIECPLADGSPYRLDATGNSDALALTLENVRIEAKTLVADKTALQQAIAAAEAIDLTGCTADSAAALTAALDAARTVAADPDALQPRVDKALVALNEAVMGLTADDQPLPGDVDGSGAVTAADALMALQAATGKILLTEREQTAADVDGKPGVSAADALLILQYATGKITAF